MRLHNAPKYKYQYYEKEVYSNIPTRNIEFAMYTAN